MSDFPHGPDYRTGARPGKDAQSPYRRGRDGVSSQMAEDDRQYMQLLASRIENNSVRPGRGTSADADI